MIYDIQKTKKLKKLYNDYFVKMKIKNVNYKDTKKPLPIEVIKEYWKEYIKIERE